MVRMTLERKEREKEQRSKVIVDAAEQLFFSKTYDEITIEGIAKKAQFAKGTLYLYFKSKEALYYAVALRGVSVMNTMFNEAASQKKNGLEKAFAIGEAYCAFSDKYPEYFRVLVNAENLPFASSDDENALRLMEISDENLRIVMNAIAEGMNDGSVKPGMDPLQAAIFLIQSTTAMILLPNCFDMVLKSSGANKQAVLKFTLESLRRAIENTQERKGEFRR